MSSYGRTQDAVWDVLERFGIDPLMKANPPYMGDGRELDLVDALVEMGYMPAYNMGRYMATRQGDERSE